MTVLDEIRGEDTLPRRNGELVFDAPWESRAFGIAVALAEDDRCGWEDFRTRLIAEIAAWEAGHEFDTSGWSYYARWLAALERLVLERGLVTEDELTRAVDAAAHDAEHEHEHDRDERPHEHG